MLVIVAGADVGVAAQAFGFVAHDQGGFGVRLQAHDAVDHVDADFLQFLRQGNIALLIEARFEFHDGDHLLAGFRRRDQGGNERIVVARAVKRDLDGHHVGIISG